MGKEKASDFYLGMSDQRFDFILNQAFREESENKNIFLISQPKHMLWVLKRTVSVRRFC